jgi:hypothetical protein
MDDVTRRTLLAATAAGAETSEPAPQPQRPGNFATTHSSVLFTPNGLLQRMRRNGSSSWRTRAAALAASKSI